jgi:hypothetical protein
MAGITIIRPTRRFVQPNTGHETSKIAWWHVDPTAPHQNIANTRFSALYSTLIMLRLYSGPWMQGLLGFLLPTKNL